MVTIIFIPSTEHSNTCTYHNNRTNPEKYSVNDSGNSFPLLHNVICFLFPPQVFTYFLHSPCYAIHARSFRVKFRSLFHIWHTVVYCHDFIVCWCYFCDPFLRWVFIFLIIVWNRTKITDLRNKFLISRQGHIPSNSICTFKYCVMIWCSALNSATVVL